MKTDLRKNLLRALVGGLIGLLFSAMIMNWFPDKSPATLEIPKEANVSMTGILHPLPLLVLGPMVWPAIIGQAHAVWGYGSSCDDQGAYGTMQDLWTARIFILLSTALFFAVIAFLTKFKRFKETLSSGSIVAVAIFLIAQAGLFYWLYPSILAHGLQSEMQNTFMSLLSTSFMWLILICPVVGIYYLFHAVVKRKSGSNIARFVTAVLIVSLFCFANFMNAFVLITIC